ncbi:exodeoxyribonuclease III, partial [Streptococcus anginosus]|nr:exodeoxyribonuclease III [Streptococcus anginosus]
CTPAQFPREIFEEAGYEVACAGLNQWNGVAILSRVGIENVQVGFPGQPGFSKVDDDGALLSAPTVEARALGARLGSGPAAVNVWSLYIPNGRAYGDPHFHYKLEFLGALRAAVSARLGEEPEYPLLLAGDWNVAP